MKLMSFLKRHSKKFAVLGVVSVAVISAGVVSSWGPDRPTYTVENPADHITFNSITDNPNVGDERNFVVVKDAADANPGGWKDDVTVEPGKEYLVRIYAHNNAASSLNLTALNTRVSATVPTTTAKSVPLSGFVSADNATPSRIWDDINFNSEKNFNLAYVAGSAKIYNNGYAAGGNGQSLPDSIVTSDGALIGYNGANGEVPGCFQYANYITFKVKPQFELTPNFEVNKTVSTHDKFEWKENVEAKPGETVDYRIHYKNTGETQQDNVVVKDKLPAHMSYINGTAKLYNAQNPDGKKLSDNLTNGTGVNIGSHAAGASSFVVFSAKVGANDELPECGPNTLKNIGRVETPNGSKEDDATVTVPKECKNNPIYECTALQAEPLGGNKYRFTTTVRMQNATVNKYTYKFGDNTAELNTDQNVVEHQYAAPGTYNIEVRVLFNVDDEQKEARCTAQVVIPSTPPPVTPPTPGKPGQPGSPVSSIPATGIAGVVAGIFGTSATAYGLYAWAESRRALKNVK